MPSMAQKVRKSAPILVSLLIILSFVVSFIVLFILYPSSFEETWKGRTYYLFFLWLVSLEMILNWERLQTNQLNRTVSIRTAIFAISLALPVVYVLVANFLGLNEGIVDFSMLHNMESWFAKQMPVSTEYLVFGAMFFFMNVTTYGRKSLADFSISTSLLFIVGIIYMLDNFFPRGQFTPFQFPVLATATLASTILNAIGYGTRISVMTNPSYGWMPNLTVWDPNDLHARAAFGIAWPCAGIESFLIYAVTILLFLRKTNVPTKHKIIYFSIGAIITYFINIIRVVTIFLIQINFGSAPRRRFHDYYGQLFSITWIILYPLMIIGGRLLWKKFTSQKTHVQSGLNG